MTKMNLGEAVLCYLNNVRLALCPIKIFMGGGEGRESRGRGGGRGGDNSER